MLNIKGSFFTVFVLCMFLTASLLLVSSSGCKKVKVFTTGFVDPDPGEKEGGNLTGVQREAVSRR